MSLYATILLTTGRAVPVPFIEFDRASHRFFYSGADITDGIRRADKIAYFGGQGFDVEQDNLRLYGEKNPGAAATGSTSIFDAFWGQILTDPLAAPLDYADTAVSTTVRSTTGKLLLAGLVVGGLYYFRNDLKKFLS